MIVRLLSALVLSVLITSGYTGTAPAGELTKDTCETDYQDLLSTIEGNRIAGIEQINQHLIGVTDETKRSQLIEMRENSWHEEEKQRAMAASILRDCLAAVKE